MRFLPVFIALPLVVAFGVAEGQWTNRWSDSHDLERAVARLGALPATVGDWDSTDETLDPRQVARAEIAGYVLRRYTNRHTAVTLSMLLVCGLPGPTSLHTPEICFPASGYNETAPAQRRPVSASGLAEPAEFWAARFQKGGDIVEPLRTYWAWNATGAWIASEHPRFEFGRYAFLYKLYVTEPLTRTAEETQAADASAEFLAAFLPEVHKHLFAEP